MFKIRGIQFIDHPVLGNLKLDFCGPDGKAVDTVIFAGENGTGKSTIIDFLYRIASYTVDIPVEVEIESYSKIIHLTYHYSDPSNKESLMYINDGQGCDMFIRNENIKHKYYFSGIFSDVDINFHSDDVSTVTSLSLDAKGESRRSTTNLPREINQLLIDIQAMDDSELSNAYRMAKSNGQSTENLEYNQRMPRFTTAFNRMFDSLKYGKVINRNGKKVILFEKNGQEIPISGLSSGEKQVVYRGCFLLKDVNALNGAFVFIDEPEISLHPLWQEKIMDYYKGIFTDIQGKQTSQLFVVTHSPFIIHNPNRRNDKVIVLARDEAGNIIVKDKPEYYKCSSAEVVEDAFSIRSFSESQSTVYLEGQTDEKYFNKALEVYDYNVPFRFKWVGYIDENGQEANTGASNVDKAFQFLVAQNLPIKNFCLKDGDTNTIWNTKNNVTKLTIPTRENKKGMNSGIENALVLDEIDLTPYYITKTKRGNYGEESHIQEFDKMTCCDAICSMDTETLKKVFVHLKETIENLIDFYNG